MGWGGTHIGKGMGSSIGISIVWEEREDPTQSRNDLVCITETCSESIPHLSTTIVFGIPIRDSSTRRSPMAIGVVLSLS